MYLINIDCLKQKKKSSPSDSPCLISRVFFYNSDRSRPLLMTNEQFLESLKLFYSNKSSSQIDELYDSARKDQFNSNEFMDLMTIFIETDDGHFSSFISTLIDQIHRDKIDYVEQIKQIVIGYPLITVAQFIRAIYTIDPKIDQPELSRYIDWVFARPGSEFLERIPSIDFEDLLRRLENCACFQH